MATQAWRTRTDDRLGDGFISKTPTASCLMLEYADEAGRRLWPGIYIDSNWKRPDIKCQALIFVAELIDHNV
jgi:hypothetical protein